MTDKHFSPTAAQRKLALPASVRWTNARGTAMSASATPALLDRELYLASAIRVGNRYPRQRNYHGKYYFSQTGYHVWHESLLEAAVLTWLDMSKDIVAIASQPMEIVFADGLKHIPDYLAYHADHRQVVYDVKPPRYLTPKYQAQFAKTRALCEHVGWGYEVHTGFPEQVGVNLSWFSAFKHPGFFPGPDATERLLAALTAPLTLLNAARALKLERLANARSAIYHLVWVGVITVDLTQRIDDRTTVERNSDERA